MKRILGAVCFSGMIAVISLIAAVGLLDMIFWHVGTTMNTSAKDYKRLMVVGGGTFLLLWAAAAAVSFYKHLNANL